VEPGAGRLAEIRERRHRIDGGHRRRPHSRDDRGDSAALELLRDGGYEHPEVAVGRHLPRLEAEQPGGFLHRRMSVLGEHDCPAPGAMAGGDEGREGRGRGGVLDVAVPAGRQSKELGQPVHDVRLELGRGG
jgi:hypothetical protein